MPDDASEALIEPVKNGRPGALAVAQGRIWSPEWGVQEIEDHLKKQKIVEEGETLKAQQKADREQRVREANERAKPVKKAEKAEKGIEKDEKTSK